MQDKEITLNQLIEKITQYTEKSDSENTQEIIELLSLKDIIDNDGQPGLQLIVLNAPQLLKKLLDLSKTKSELRNAIINALSIQNNNAWNALHVICRHAPDIFLELIELSKTDSHLTDVIAESIPVLQKKIVQYCISLQLATQNYWVFC